VSLTGEFFVPDRERIMQERFVSLMTALTSMHQRVNAREYCRGLGGKLCQIPLRRSVLAAIDGRAARCARFAQPASEAEP